MDLDWKSIAGAVAPLAPKLGTVLGTTIGGLVLPGIGAGIGGSIGGIAGRAIAAAFGVEATPEAVGKAIAEDPKASEKLAQLEQDRGDEILAAAQVEVERLKQETERFRIGAQDTQSARDFSQQISSTPLSRVQRVLAYGFCVSFFAILVLMLVRPEFKMSEAFILMLGVLTGAMKDIIQFFFGSSASSQGKDMTLKQMAVTAAAAGTEQTAVREVAKAAVQAAAQKRR